MTDPALAVAILVALAAVGTSLLAVLSGSVPTIGADTSTLA